METIFAQASAPGKSGVAVFRISGSNTLKILGEFCKTVDLKPRMTHVRKILHPETQEYIDQAMVIYFKAPHSFTGEDVVELHLHGSVAVCNLMHEILFAMPDIRLAEPGEFAKRSFLNGKMDLTAAEGLADLIEAETSMQHKQAVRQMGGELEVIFSGWKKNILRIMGLIEAYIDFPDEDIPDNVTKEVVGEVEQLKQKITKYLDDNKRGERLRNGLYLTIFGAPNVGKSSLMNFVAQREIAIVSDIAGTTRDVLEAHIDIGGYPIILSDTAGLHEGGDEIEGEGIKRAKDNIANADIKIAMFNAANFTDLDMHTLEMIDKDTLIIVNKSDLVAEEIIESTYYQHMSKHRKLQCNHMVKISVKAEQGMQHLLKEIEKIADNIARPAETLSVTRLRHRNDLTQALACLEKFDVQGDIVLAAEELRMAARYLSMLVGEIDTEEILGEIFSNFCIGK